MKDNQLGKGIATSGIWIGVGLIGAFNPTPMIALVALFAFLATAAVWNR